MDEKPKPKFRFSLRAALAAMLAIAVGIGLLRIAAHDPVVLAAAVSLLVLTFCVMLAYVSDRPPLDGVAWAVLILVALAVIASLTPTVRY